MGGGRLVRARPRRTRVRTSWSFELSLTPTRSWCQWYGRFWMGRRCADDSRQLDRWKKISTAASGRWRRMFYGKYVAKGIETISPTKEEVSKVIRSVLFTWGYEPNTPDLHLFMREKSVPITVPEE